MTELRDGKVCRERCLTSFFADDTNANVCSLDHGNVVTAVADATHSLLGVGADECRNFGFLHG